MIRAILWKEWRENRWKYATFWLILNAPTLLLVIALAFSTTARTPFSDLSNAMAPKYLAIMLLAVSGLIFTVFQLLNGFLAVATFGPELEDKSLFFIYEQPVSRSRYFATKFMIGACQMILAVGFAILLGPVAVYGVMLASGKVTLAGSAGTLAIAMAAALRAAVWCSLVSLMVFAACTLLTALLSRFWIALAGSVVLIVVFGLLPVSDFFDFIKPMFDAIPDGTSSISVSFGTDRAHWLTVVGSPPIGSFAPWKALPLMTAMLLTTVLAAATGFLYSRRELK